MGTPLVEDAGVVRRITLNRPEALNAMRPDDLDVIADAVESAGDNIRAIVVTGSGPKSFCAGMHTESFEGLDRDQARDVISRVGRAVGSLRLSPKITVVELNGYCIGAALEMALAADFRVARAGVLVGLPEVKLGIPSVVDAALLQEYVGLSMAKEMILTGDLYPIEQLQPSIVNRYGEADQLPAVTADLLAPLVELTPTVVRTQKDLLEAWLNKPLADGIAYSIEAFADCFDHPETRAAISAYRAKG